MIACKKNMNALGSAVVGFQREALQIAKANQMFCEKNFIINLNEIQKNTNANFQISLMQILV